MSVKKSPFGIIATRFDEVRLIYVAETVWRRKWIAIAAFCAAFFLILSVGLSITPKFEATAVIVVGGSTTELDALRRTGAVSLARIAESNEVVRDAIESVGVKRLIGSDASEFSSFSRLKGGLNKILSAIGLDGFAGMPRVSKELESRSSPSMLDIATAIVGKSISVKADASSDIIRISYRHPDPSIAAAFVNALSDAFIDKQLDVFSRPGAAKFYENQANKFDQDIKDAADALETYSNATDLYSIDSQSDLLLKRLNDLSASLNSTKGAIAEKLGQKETLTAQLQRLKPVTQSPFVSSLVDDLGSVSSKRAPSRSASERQADPPLLMVRVYQDAIVNLFKLNSDIDGLIRLEQSQIDQLSGLHAELRNLTSKSAEFSRLSRAVKQASINAEIYARRYIEEKISADLNTAKISPLKIIQRAFTPLQHVFPNYAALFLMALVFGAISGVLAAMYLGYLKTEDTPNNFAKDISSLHLLDSDISNAVVRRHGRSTHDMS